MVGGGVTSGRREKKKNIYQHRYSAVDCTVSVCKNKNLSESKCIIICNNNNRVRHLGLLPRGVCVFFLFFPSSRTRSPPPLAVLVDTTRCCCRRFTRAVKMRGRAGEETVNHLLGPFRRNARSVASLSTPPSRKTRSHRHYKRMPYALHTI